MKPENRQIFEFAEFRFDLSEKALSKNGVPIHLTPKVLDTLAVLVQNAGRLLEKDELMQAIWQDRFVEEGNLAFNIKVIRKALGDSASEPRFIETVQRRGYRFIAPVRPAETNGTRADSTFQDKSIDRPAVDQPEPHKDPSLDDTKRRRVPVAAVIAGLSILIAVGYAGYRFFGTTWSSPEARLTSAERLTANGNVGLAALSPDGKFLVYSAGESGKQGLWLKNIAAGSESPITLTSGHTSFNSLTFSPDGNFIFYGSKGRLFRLPLLGNTPVQVLGDFGGEITFSPDGGRFAYITYPPENRETAVLMVASADGSERMTLASSSRPRLFLRSAAWSPGGDHIACAALNPDGYQEIAVIKVADGTITTLPSPQWNTVLRAAWKPDGTELLVVAEERNNLLNQIWTLSFPDGEARRITSDSYNYQSVAVAADGRSIAAVRAEQTAHLWLMPAGDRQQIRQITSGFEKYDGVFALNWTPEGKILFTNAPSGRPALWRSNEDGSGLERMQADVIGSVISPDGRFAVFQDTDENGTGLFKLDLSDGTRTRVTEGTDDHPAISPDGSSIVFTRFADDVALWKTAINGGEPRKITDFPGYPTGSVFSPDGSRIAFYRGASSGAASPTIAITSADGGAILREFPVPVQFSRNWFAKTALQWSGDGQAIYFLSLRDKASNIFRQPIDGGEAVQVTDFTDGLIFNFAFSPDGSKLMVSRGSFSRDVILLTRTD